MTALIKLTRVPTRWAPAEEGPIWVNPANVTKIYKDPEIADATIVDFQGSVCCIVKETPEEIAKLIWNAESIERKCRQCDGDGEANTFKPSVQKLEITMPSGCPDFYGLKEAPATSRGCSHCKECWEEAIENWLNKKYKEA